jgi:hypothetical protein
MMAEDVFTRSFKNAPLKLEKVMTWTPEDVTKSEKYIRLSK